LIASVSIHRGELDGQDIEDFKKPALSRRVSTFLERMNELEHSLIQLGYTGILAPSFVERLLDIINQVSVQELAQKRFSLNVEQLEWLLLIRLG